MKQKSKFICVFLLFGLLNCGGRIEDPSYFFTKDATSNDTSSFETSTNANDSSNRNDSQTLDATLRSCGGFIGNSLCTKNEFCAFAEGACDIGSGSCTETPSSCPKNIDPVCGCDDKKYDNACLAAQAGVSVKKKGSC